MKGDFSRLTFDPDKNYTGVLLQQGRVLTDADWNEMVGINNYYYRTFIRDLVGPFGGFVNNCGFGIKGHSSGKRKLHLDSGDFLIENGHYYINGILCENNTTTTFCNQPYLPSRPLTKGRYLVYLDVWERHITAIEDPKIREVALGSAVTATRTKLIWQVKVHRLNRDINPSLVNRRWDKLIQKWYSFNRGNLSACVDTGNANNAGKNGYNGMENYLYRIEIHRGGKISESPTFKWSRNNGAIAFAISNIEVDTSNQTTAISLNNPAHTEPLSTILKNWVEISDDNNVLKGEPGLMMKVSNAINEDNKVILEGVVGDSVCTVSSGSCTLRCWDQTESKGIQFHDGAIAIKEGSDDESYIDIENSIRIRFDPGSNYKCGDYWLIPARIQNNNIEWPHDNGNPLSKPPAGIEHNFAPLAIIKIDKKGKSSVKDCRSVFSIKLKRPDT